MIRTTSHRIALSRNEMVRAQVFITPFTKLINGRLYFCAFSSLRQLPLLLYRFLILIFKEIITRTMREQRLWWFPFLITHKLHTNYTMHVVTRMHLGGMTFLSVDTQTTPCTLVTCMHLGGMTFLLQLQVQLTMT